MIRNSKSDIHYELSVLRSMRDKVESQMHHIWGFNVPKAALGSQTCWAPTLPGTPVPPAPAPKAALVMLSACAAAVAPLQGLSKGKEAGSQHQDISAGLEQEQRSI